MIETLSKTGAFARSRGGLIAVLGAGAVLAGCASAPPVAYSGLESSPQLLPNSGDKSGRTPFRYAAPVNWSRYDKVMVEPVAIYRGGDAQFGKMGDREKVALADYMGEEFTEALGRSFKLVSRPDANTLRVRLTLTGAKASNRVLAPMLHFDLAGGSYNAVQGVRGGEAVATGSVTYAVEVYDGGRGDLLAAFVSKQYPNAMNLKASFGSLSAPKAGIRKGAEDLVERLRSN